MQAYPPKEAAFSNSNALHDSAAPESTDCALGEHSDNGAGDPASATYILSTNTHMLHYPSCPSVDDMSEKNKEELTGIREDVIAMGYDPASFFVSSSLLTFSKHCFFLLMWRTRARGTYLSQ